MGNFSMPLVGLLMKAWDEVSFSQRRNVSKQNIRIIEADLVQPAHQQLRRAPSGQ
jgi:hypothetical protein